ncbi:hypothetical protein B4U80_03338 [Leptotrombidium deliense]|uniref:Jumonji domain-containing protein 4 n=1 Tax=Leptotrombidium deliense TaxID=299467 RepID=A0A443S3F0_9ACAR|nr:hypothetical protein B4U80_03338 [Leptotrombidium deliense]
MTFDEYLDYFVESSSKNNRLTCDVRKCLYLKNWHFVQQFPGYEAYKVPIYFESDYLNEYWHQKDDDYKFVYLGPKGSWFVSPHFYNRLTPLHTDVYSSYSWSANIAGRKKWLFIKPEDAVKVKKRYKQVPNDVRSLSSELDIEIIEVIQNSGEIIFVPSNWMHQVFNLEDTLSINHNWFNACNLYLIWNELRVAFRDTQLELRDICDLCDTFTYNQECEKLLKANYGMDYSQFIDILNVVVKRIVNNSTDDYNCEFRLHHEVQVITSLLQDNEFLKELQLIPELESKVNDLKCALALVKKEEMSNC